MTCSSPLSKTRENISAKPKQAHGHRQEIDAVSQDHLVRT